MFRKLFIILNIFCFVLPAGSQTQKSPHGKNFRIACNVCHNTETWSNVNRGGFNHNKTRFPLRGQHQTIACKACHESLDFTKTPISCNACHVDVHEKTTGTDCARCHNPNSWIVTNTKQIHQQVGFALIGSHAVADCSRCHRSASTLRFDNIRSDCYACHQAQYLGTRSPNHRAVGFSQDCERCHNMIGQDWSFNGKGFDHGSFPLTGGHNIDCGNCHINYQYTRLSTDCKSCHSNIYPPTSSPVHSSKFLDFQCTECHNTTAWTNIQFKRHDTAYGRIYSGQHKGEWSRCTDCHKNDASYNPSCKKCHSFSSGDLP